MATTIGTWKLVSSENFDELMKELGVGLITRKIGNTTKPTVKISQEGDEWTMKTESAIKTQTLKFKTGVEIDEETLDGRKVKSTFTLDGDKLVQTQKDKDNNVVCTIVRHLNNEGKLVTVATANNVVSTRIYDKE